jgi:hypothetical protein
MNQLCAHAADLPPVAAPLDVCEACILESSDWVHLRQCVVCGQTLCCDNSPKQHMSGHWLAVGHPVMRSAEAGEAWTWCYPDEAMIRETPDGWATYDPFVVNGIAVAAAHLAAGGTPFPDAEFVTRDGLPLGDWFAYVRELRDAHDLDPRDVAAMEAIPGWRW